MDGEGAQGTATLSTQTVVLLDSVEDVLAHDITNFILIIAFKTNKSCMDLKKKKKNTEQLSLKTSLKYACSKLFTYYTFNQLNFLFDEQLIYLENHISNVIFLCNTWEEQLLVA